MLIQLYSHLTGYFSVSTASSTGLERYYNQVLNGSSNSQTLAQIKTSLTGEKPKGGGIELTINNFNAKATAQALGNLRGAVVALNLKPVLF